MKTTVYFLLFIILLCSCSNQSIPRGVVAVVNGSHITLKDLRNRYDVQTMHISEFTTPPVESLHNEYTETLLEMVIELAVEQELQKHKITISDEAIEQAVKEIQGGYSDEEFSQMLAERYIDFESWKKQIRAGVVENLYLKHVLSNKVTASSEEIKEFYGKNPSLFTVDYKITGFLISSKDRNNVESVIGMFEKGDSKEKIMTVFKKVKIEPILPDSSNIPLEHIDEVIKIALNKATSIQNQEDGMYSSLFILTREKQAKLSLEESWDIAQNYVIEKKVKTLYQSAVDGILQRSSILVVDEFKNAIKNMITPHTVDNPADAQVVSNNK